MYGLGCHPDDVDAVHRLLALKQRSWRRGVIIIGTDIEQLEPYMAPLAGADRKRLEASWPGAVTWLVPAGPAAVPWLTGAHQTIAVRVPDHADARDLCRTCETPLVSTSANLSGRPAARDQLDVRRAFGAAVDYILPGAVGGRDGPSEIRELGNNRVLRS